MPQIAPELQHLRAAVQVVALHCRDFWQLRGVLWEPSSHLRQNDALGIGVNSDRATGWFKCGCLTWLLAPASACTAEVL